MRSDPKAGLKGAEAGDPGGDLIVAQSVHTVFNESAFDSLDHRVRQRLRSLPNSEVEETEAIRRRR